MIETSTQRRAVDVDIRHVDLSYGSNHVLKDVNLHIKPGEFFAFLGPSGCGKTTLLRLIAGFNVADRGEVLIGAQDVSRLAPWQRDVGMVFQSYALWPHMNVAQNVAFGLEERKVPRQEITKRVMAALDLVGLTHLADRKPSQLSGGQQQRVAVARTIVIEPKVLLLDEPLSNLDAKLREQMRVELRDLQRRVGTTTIYVTHDQEEAMSLSDRVAVMNEGRVVEVAHPRALYLRPRTRFAAQFVGQADLLEGTVVAVDGDARVVDTPLGRLSAIASAPAGAEASAEGESLGTTAGSGVSVLIRPEHIELHAATRGARNEVPGVIERLMFSGRIVEYVVMAGDQRVRVQGTSREMFETGQSVVMVLPPEHCVVVTA